MFRTDKQRKAAMARIRGSKNESAKPLTLEEYQRINAQRPPGALMLDLLQAHRHTLPAEDPSSRIWLRDHGAIDIVGVDDPMAEAAAATAARDAPHRGMDDDFVVIDATPRKAHRRPMTERQKQIRAKNLERLKEYHQIQKRHQDLLKRQLKQARGSGDAATAKDLERQLDLTQRRTKNSRRQIQAYTQGKYLIFARKEDEALAREHARNVASHFDFHPRSVASPVVYVGTTTHAGVYGYTHAYEPIAGVQSDFIAVHKSIRDKAHADKRRGTEVHEQIHVLRGHEGGRRKNMRGVQDYGRDFDIEEKWTVLEQEARGAPQGTKKNQSYYSVLRNEPGVPDNVGNHDNRTVRAARHAKREPNLKTIEQGILKRGHKTHIAKLTRKGGFRGLGKIPDDVEDVDRVFTTVDGDTLHAYNPAQLRQSPKQTKALVDSIDGRKGDRVYEYKDGKRRPLGGRE